MLINMTKSFCFRLGPVNTAVGPPRIDRASPYLPSQNLGRPRNASALHRFCVTESTVDEEKCQRKSPASLKIKDKEV